MCLSKKGGVIKQRDLFFCLKSPHRFDSCLNIYSLTFSENIQCTLCRLWSHFFFTILFFYHDVMCLTMVVFITLTLPSYAIDNINKDEKVEIHWWNFPPYTLPSDPSHVLYRHHESNYTNPPHVGLITSVLRDAMYYCKPYLLTRPAKEFLRYVCQNVLSMHIILLTRTSYSYEYVHFFKNSRNSVALVLIFS